MLYKSIQINILNKYKAFHIIKKIKHNMRLLKLRNVEGIDKEYFAFVSRKAMTFMHLTILINYSFGFLLVNSVTFRYTECFILQLYKLNRILT